MQSRQEKKKNTQNKIFAWYKINLLNQTDYLLVSIEKPEDIQIYNHYKSSKNNQSSKKNNFQDNNFENNLQKKSIIVFANNCQYKALLENLIQYVPQQKKQKLKNSQYNSTNSSFQDLSSSNRAQFINKLRMYSKSMSNQKNIIKINNSISIQLFQPQLNHNISQNSHSQSDLFSFFRFQINKLLFSQVQILNVFVVGGQDISQQFINKYWTPLHHKKYLQQFFHSISQTPKLWPYRFTLKSIQKLYNLFFSQCNIKFQVTFDSQQKKIIKLLSFPLVKFQESNLCNSDNVGRQNTVNLFQGQIFNLLQSQSDQTKMFYKLPFKKRNKKNQIIQTNLKQIIQTFLSLGFKISEIKQIIFCFSAIMNLSQLTIQEFININKSKEQILVRIKQDETYYKILQIFNCKEYLIKNLILEKQKAETKINKEKALKNIQIIIRLLWETTLQYLSNELNEKLTNNKCTLNQLNKKITLICYNNRIFKDQSHFQEGSQRQIESKKINSYIWKHVIKQNTNFEKHQGESQKLKDIKNHQDLQKQMTKWKQQKIDQIYSLINIPFIKKQAQLRDKYHKIKQSNQFRQILQHLLGNFSISNYNKRLFYCFKDVLRKQPSNLEKNHTQNHFLIKINCDKITKQAENNLLFKLIQSLVLKKNKISLQSQLIESNNNNTISYEKIQQDQLFNEKSASKPKNNINSDDFRKQYFQTDSVTIDINDFVQNYFYCNQLSKIRSQFNLSFKQFNYSLQIQKTKDSLVKYLSRQTNQIQLFQCKMKSPKLLQVSQSTFNNLQIQNLYISSIPKRIINQYRAYKFRKQLLKNLNKFHLSNLFFLKLQSFIKNKKRQNFKHLKKRIGVKRIFQFLAKKRQKFSNLFLNSLKKNRISNILFNALNKMYFKLSIFNKKGSFKYLKAKHYKIKSSKAIFQILNNLISIKEVKSQFFSKIPRTKQYALIVTSPKGGKTNYHDLSIQISQANKTISHPGNTSTSNVKNSLSYGTKGFNKINLFPIEQEDSVSSHQSQKNKDIQKSSVNQKRESQKAEEKKQDKLKKQEQRQYNSKNKSNLNESKVSELSNSLVSQKSQIVDLLKKQQLYLIKDFPHFSFQSWYEDSIKLKKIESSQPSKACQTLFKKDEPQKAKPIVQDKKQIEEDQTIKERIILHSFMNYLKEYVNLKGNQKIQDVIKVQQKLITEPILKSYPLATRPNTFSQIFNVILKLGLHKNTSKSFEQLINLILKPIKQIYNQELSKANNLFNDQPLMTNSYSSQYNAVRDEMFLQFIKQIMGNEDLYSIKSLINSLQIITRYIYPSNVFFYAFLSYVKSSHSKRTQLYDPIYHNMLIFSQAVEGNKGTKVKIYKNETLLKSQLQNTGYLYPRTTQLDKIECTQLVTIKVKLPNGASFEYQVRNQIFKSIKRKVLQKIGFLHNQKNYALYQYKGLNNYLLIQDKAKVIDFLIVQNSKQLKTKFNQVYLRTKHYYPIKIRQINHLRMFYLTMISDQGRLPWKMEQYQNIVALSMLFDQFQQFRISNYLTLSKKLTNKQPDLSKIQTKFTAIANQGSKKISQFQYFKRMKQSNFLLAKCYKQQQQKREAEQQVKIIIKPRQLCFYQGNQIKSSINLHRIKSVFFDNNQISIELIYSKQQREGSSENQFFGQKRILMIKGFFKIKELFQDLLYYCQLLIK